MTTQIVYDTWTVKGTPTPYNKLLICDKCGTGHWWTDSDTVQYCHLGHGRLREGNKQEYLDAKTALKTVIG